MGQYTALLAELQKVATTFGVATDCKMLLCHDLIWGPEGGLWSEPEFAAFCSSNAAARNDVYEKWVLWPNKRAGSRFWSPDAASLRFISFFELMATQAMQLLAEVADLPPTCEDLPRNVVVGRLLQNDLWDDVVYGWLTLVHETAIRFPIPRLLGECSWWRYDGALGADPDSVAEHKSIAANSTSYHTWPIHHLLKGDLFKASAACIEFFVTPHAAPRLGHFDGPPEIFIPPAPSQPIWNNDTGELRLNSTLVKKFEKPAPLQRRILDEFQRLRWPREIRNPFLDEGVPNHIAKQTIKDTVQGLNDHHQQPNLVHFGSRSGYEYVCLKVMNRM
ncbi:MAG: hypothetical protein K1X57_14935 [Gemmataceae bacterium]|nr:hypothetical protein [Gemmataceae bacterium]